MRQWWGPVPFSTDTIGAWRIGALSLWARRRDGELRLARVGSGDPLDDTLQVSLPAATAPPESATVERYMVAPDAPATLELTPLLADRPIVARPDAPFVLPPEHSTQVFISTLVWLQLRVGRTSTEMPTHRPSDTWFGPPTGEGGVLCYASRTRLRRQLEQVPRRPNRVITTLTIHNRGTTPLRVTRLRLPMAQLSIHSDADNTLWTEAITMQRDQGDDASVTVAERPPIEAGPVTRVSGPRGRDSTLTVLRVFNSLIS